MAHEIDAVTYTPTVMMTVAPAEPEQILLFYFLIESNIITRPFAGAARTTVDTGTV